MKRLRTVLVQYAVRINSSVGPTSRKLGASRGRGISGVKSAHIFSPNIRFPPSNTQFALASDLRKESCQTSVKGKSCQNVYLPHLISLINSRNHKKMVQ